MMAAPNKTRKFHFLSLAETAFNLHCTYFSTLLDRCSYCPLNFDRLVSLLDMQFVIWHALAALCEDYLFPRLTMNEFLSTTYSIVNVTG